MERLAILESYFTRSSVASFQLESYNYFIEHELRHLMRGVCMTIPSIHPNQTRHVLFQCLYASKPTSDTETSDRPLYPTECRQRNMTYDTNVYASCMIISLDDTNHVVHIEHLHGIHLFRIPVMLRSVLCNLSNKDSRESDERLKECPNDKGGYFVIQGKDRVIVSQERMNYNHIYVLPSKHPKYLYTAEIRSVRGLGDYSMLHEMHIPSISFVGNRPIFPLGSHIMCTFGKRHREIPLQAFLNYYAIDEQMIQRFPFKTQLVIRHILNQPCEKNIDEPDVFFPHLGENVEPRLLKQRILYFLLCMLDRLVRTTLGERAIDHRDHLNNKRVDTAGILLKHLISGLLKIMCKKISMYWSKHQNTSLTLTLLFQKYTITPALHTCFTKGHWGIPKTKYIRQGVVQMLTRQSYTSTISHLRRVIVPIGKESKNSQVRQIHASSWGFICPIETPDGASCGLVKNLALYTRISHTTPVQCIHAYIVDYLKNNPQNEEQGMYVVCCNTIPIAYDLSEERARHLVHTLRHYRKTFYIDWSVSISIQEYDKCVSIYTDEGRLMRPVLTTKTPSSSQFYELWERGDIVYIDSYEAESCYIHLDDTEEKHDEIPTYYEIHPTVMFGIGASVTPFSNHSQAPRNIYQCAMAKQAMGWNHLRIRDRFDTCNHILNYPQKRIVHTKQVSWLHLNEMASGHNVIVAIMSYSGFNQEDSVLINRGAIDRGLFICTTLRTLSISIKQRNGVVDKETIQIPPTHIQQRGHNYDLLQTNGIVAKGTHVHTNDVVVGKVLSSNGTMNDCSLVVGENEGGVVDEILQTIDSSGKEIIKIRIRSQRRPEIGDKVASSAAQKGTIGMIFAHEDMPFTEQGIVPDVILNPHAIPSRMTINMLMEMLSAKNACLKGTFEDATAFTKNGNEWIRTIGESLLTCGFEKTGEEHMYNGMTGEPLQCSIYIGICYYERLKHMVSEKYHTRTRGNVQLLNRQPCAGRSRDGGLKFGEMERDCMITHGTAHFLRERLFSYSDQFQIPICNQCHSISNHRERCQCGSTHIQLYHLPYACKLLFQDLMALGIQLQLN